MIRVENLNKTYDRRTRHANKVIHGMSFTLPDRGFVCILGASGCGKTSLLNAIGGLDSFDSGKIITDTAEIKRAGSRTMERERNSSFGYIFQNYYLLSEHSAAYNVYIGMHSMPISKKEKAKRVTDALRRVDMLRYKKRPVGNLSGGQQQRVAIARAIARAPKVIFADEPTGNLDEANTMNICTILKELSKESLVVMVTHEQRVAKFFADRIITLEDGNIISDTTSWRRETMDAGEKDAIYTDEYSESKVEADGISIRVLSGAGAEPVSLSVVVENNRIVIKSADPRVLLASSENNSPKIIEGARPVLTSESFDTQAEEKEKQSVCESSSKSGKSGLGLGLIFREARSLVSGKKLRKFSTGLFIILLSLMIALTVSDILTVSHIDPEEFVTADSHTLDFSFERGPDLPKNIWFLDEYREKYMEFLEGSGLDFDYIPKGSALLKYTDSTIPQLGNVTENFGNYSYVNISRLDEKALIAGRMPERYDEIIVDRWVIDALLSEEGILQNIIPNSEYFVGKSLKLDKKTFSPKIVGISDSGEPAIYVSTEALLSIGVGGTEVITLSEFKTITGYTGLESLSANECIVLTDTAGTSYSGNIGGVYSPSSGYFFTIRDAVEGTLDKISAKFVVADDALPLIYKGMIKSTASFGVWCADKDAMYSFLETDLPNELVGMISVGVKDKYQLEYTEYEKNTNEKVSARTIVTLAVLLLSLVMLYLMQRSKIKVRMDLIAVYRLLGIKKRSLVLIFALESTFLTLKYSIPTILAAYLAIKGLGYINLLENIMIYPLWAAGLTLLSILAVRLIIAALPVLRLLSKPPAVLAAKHDF